jgi:hypothetical protein
MRKQNHRHGCGGVRRAQVGACALSAILSACGTTQAPAPAETPGAARPAAPPSATPQKSMPPLNLSGYPPAFKEGFKDGCDSFRGNYRRDTARFNADANYATGWQDGFSICRRQGK